MRTPALQSRRGMGSQCFGRLTYHFNRRRIDALRDSARLSSQMAPAAPRSIAVRAHGQAEEGAQRGIRVATKQLIDRLPGHPELPGKRTDTSDVLSMHMRPDYCSHAGDGLRPRAIARKRWDVLGGNVDVRHDSVSLASYNAVIQCARARILKGLWVWTLPIGASEGCES